MTESQLSSWQKLKMKRKTGDRKKEIEEYFGIKSDKISTKEFKKVIESTVPLKKTKKKSK